MKQFLFGILASVAVSAAMAEAPARLEREIIVATSPSAAFKFWATADGVRKMIAEDAKVELVPGGAYEWHFSKQAPVGQRGSEGCKVLSVIPDQMLAFDWNAPPSIPELRQANARTQVVVRFEPLAGDRTRVRLTQLGFGSGAAWEKYYAYFDIAWTSVFGHFKSAVKKEAASAAAETVSQSRETWIDGRVTITVMDTPTKRQDFEIILPAPVEKVWRALATTEGYRESLIPGAEIELALGGKYTVWPGAPNRVLAFIPHEMLSVSGSAPKEFPNVRNGGSWSAYTFEPLSANQTRLRLSVVGWRPGDDEWERAFDYFLLANPQFLNYFHGKLAGTKVSRGDVLRHQTIVPAPVAEVWKAFTTKEGLESWMVAKASFDLKVGGKMLTRYQKDGELGDDATIENTVLSYQPERMLSIKATKPPKNFPFKTSIENMWSVMYFEPLTATRTRVIVEGHGFTADDESKKMRQHFDAGNAWTLNKLRDHFRTKPAANTAVR